MILPSTLARNPPRRRFPALARASAALGLWAAVSTATGSPAADWPQWGQNPQHTGAAPVAGQPLQGILANVLYDPFVELEKADGGGPLFAHYAAALVDGDSVYMSFTSGTYVTFGVWDSIVWSVKRLRWDAGTLQEVWSFDSDWKPVDIALASWVPMFQAAIAGDFLYVPGAGGTVHKVSKTTGLSVGRINPFSSFDASLHVAGGLAVASDGSVYYDVLGLDPADPFTNATGAWVVRIAPNGAATRVDFATLTPGAPAADDPCQLQFSTLDAPLPPSPTAVPPTAPCGSQRPGINVVPAIGPDGTVYTLSVAHSNSRYGYLVALGPDLSPRWNASLRGILQDGCGVLLPRDNASCRDNANLGVDPRTNDRPAGRVLDSGTSSPVVLPDGTVLVGAGTFYNYSRGHLFRFDANGSVLDTYDFGWDITPAVFAHDGTYSIRIKNNYYGGPPGSEGRYELSSLDPALTPEWSFPSTSTESCERQDNGSIACMDDGTHTEGFEWCINQPAVDAAGVTYVNSEDGTLYALDRDGRKVGEIFLDTALGAAYTPVTIGPDGIIYSQNNGRLFAVGQARVPRDPPIPVPDSRPGTRTVVR